MPLFPQLEAPVRAQIQLRRPSDKQCSEARPFTFTPLDSGRPFWSFKRAKTHVSLFHRLLSWETGDEPSAKRCSSADGRRSAELASAVLGELPPDGAAPAQPAAAPAAAAAGQMLQQPPLPPKRQHRVKRDVDSADYAMPMPGHAQVEAPTKAEILLRRYATPSATSSSGLTPGRGLLASDFNNGNYERVEQMALYAGVAPLASASEFDETSLAYYDVDNNVGVPPPKPSHDDEEIYGAWLRRWGSVTSIPTTVLDLYV